MTLKISLKVHKRLRMNLPNTPSHYKKMTAFGVVSQTYPPNGSFVHQWPIAIGFDGWETRLI